MRWPVVPMTSSLQALGLCFESPHWPSPPTNVCVDGVCFHSPHPIVQEGKFQTIRKDPEVCEFIGKSEREGNLILGSCSHRPGNSNYASHCPAPRHTREKEPEQAGRIESPRACVMFSSGESLFVHALKMVPTNVVLPVSCLVQQEIRRNRRGLQNTNELLGWR